MTKEELEKEAEELIQRVEIANSMNCLTQLTPDRKQIGEMLVMFAEPREKRIAELEKENAELKSRNQELLQSCEGATMLYKDLQIATKIIKKYLTIGVGGKITQNYLDVTKEAEQFLKDSKVEK